MSESVTTIKIELESEEYREVVEKVSNNFTEIQRLLQLNADLLVMSLKVSDARRLRIEMNNTRILLSGLCCSFLMKLIIERLRNLLVKLGDKLLQRIKLDFIFNNNLKNINSADLHFWDGSSSGKTCYSINPTRKIEVNLNELILRA